MQPLMIYSIFIIILIFKGSFFLEGEETFYSISELFVLVIEDKRKKVY